MIVRWNILVSYYRWIRNVVSTLLWTVRTDFFDVSWVMECYLDCLTLLCRLFRWWRSRFDFFWFRRWRWARFRLCWDDWGIWCVLVICCISLVYVRLQTLLVGLLYLRGSMTPFASPECLKWHVLRAGGIGHLLDWIGSRSGANGTFPLWIVRCR